MGSKRSHQKSAVAGAFGKDGKPEPKPAPPSAVTAATEDPTPTESRKVASFKEAGDTLGIPTLPPAALGSRKEEKSSGPAETRAGAKEYNAFFALYAQSLVGSGLSFWPLGFIPGPALLTYGGNEVVAATPDVARQLGALPRSVAELPDEVLDAMKEWADLAHGLGYQPSSWAEGVARRLLSGLKPAGAMVVGMTRFRYRSGDGEVPFGVVLEPTSGGLRVARVHNANVADVPVEGTVLSFVVLKDGRGPVQKLLRTWALMETNFLSRYHRDGTPRERDES